MTSIVRGENLSRVNLASCTCRTLDVMRQSLMDEDGCQGMIKIFGHPPFCRDQTRLMRTPLPNPRQHSKHTAQALTPSDAGHHPLYLEAVGSSADECPLNLAMWYYQGPRHKDTTSKRLFDLHRAMALLYKHKIQHITPLQALHRQLMLILKSNEHNNER